MMRRPVLAAAVLAALCACASTKEQKGDLAGARKDFARALVERGDHAAAWAAIEPVCRANPRDAEALAIRGVVYREQGLLDEAEADLREALRRDDDLAMAHSALGILYDLTGKLEDAERHHRLAVERDPRNPRYLNNLAFSLFAHGQARHAIPVYLEAVRHDPMNPRLRNNLGFAYAVAGEWSRAKRQFDAGGNPSDARLNLGYAYEKSGNLAQAFELYAEAARLEPGSAAAKESLARVAGKLGRAIPSEVAGEAGAKAPGGGGP